jgi:hypothetical protein
MRDRENGMGVGGGDPKQVHREIEPQETARQSLQAYQHCGFVLNTFRHTCLTRWATFMDPDTLAYLAGHYDFSTHAAVHPQAHKAREAITDFQRQALRTGHN